MLFFFLFTDTLRLLRINAARTIFYRHLPRLDVLLDLDVLKHWRLVIVWPVYSHSISTLAPA